MRILLATDGSEHADEAVKQCGKIISQMGKSSVKIITVVDNFTPMATEPFISAQEFLENVEAEIQDKAENDIIEAVRILREHAKIPDLETEILFGPVKRVIVGEAEKWKADIIALGSHGMGFWGRALIGSVSDAVVHHAPCSVFVVKLDKTAGG